MHTNKNEVNSRRMPEGMSIEQNRSQEALNRQPSRNNLTLTFTMTITQQLRPAPCHGKLSGSMSDMALKIPQICFIKVGLIQRSYNCQITCVLVISFRCIVTANILT